MQHRIKIKNQEITYRIKKNSRSKNLRLCVRADASVLVTMPKFFPQILAKRFLREQADWVLGKLESFKDSQQPKVSRMDYYRNKAAARKIVLEKISFWNKHYNFKIKRIAIRNQRTRWGSCSAAGNLNFNYRICHLPENLQDYIIVHELCHLRELNHSPAFWKLVAETVPDYMAARRELKKIPKL